MLLEGFSNHLGRQASLHIPEALDRVITILNLRLVLILERLLGELLLKLCSLKVALQIVALLLDCIDRLGNRELLRNLDGVKLSLQALNLRVFRSGSFLQFILKLRLGKLGGSLLVMLCLLEFVRERVTLFFQCA